MKFVSKNFYLMGTYGKVQMFTKNVNYGIFVISKMIEKIKKIENLLTKFSPYSDIGKLNSLFLNYNKISNKTLNVLINSIYIYNFTNGYFDIGLGNLLSISGIDFSVPTTDACVKTPDFKKLIIKFFKKKVKINRNNTMIDLGGIGKGYALDETIKIALKFNIKHIAIEFGGEIKVKGGMSNGKPWIIKLNEKLSKHLEKKIDILKIKDGSIAISGNYLKRSSFNNKIKNHIINSKKIYSNNIYLFVIVKGKKSIVCDVLSTACLYMDSLSFYKIKSMFNSYIIKKYI